MNILNDQVNVFYVVRVNGREVSQRFSSPMLAEMEKAKLDPETQKIAEVATVTSDGSQLLLG